MTAAVEEPVLAALLLGKTAEASERGIGLAIDGRLQASDLPSDPRDLLTVVGNLLDNAFDAVSDSETRRVSLHLSADDGRLEVVVGDSGPGIAPEDAAHVLDRGWSTKATTTGGRGLGLALVSQVARRHGGAVTVGTSPLGGAQFSVTLGGHR